METFYEWLKHNQQLNINSKDINSNLLIGYIDLPIKIVGEPKIVKAQESACIIQMESYVNQHVEVNDLTFDKMLQDKHLKKYQKLADEYLPVDGGIASDLRNHGWQAIARYIAYQRNRQYSENDIFKTDTTSKLKKCIINTKKFLKEMLPMEK